MGENSQALHEENLPADVVDRHRAIASLMEEFEAVDWYDQRVAATTDPELAAILAHNRDEEKEHAAMVLEWLRRRDPTLDENLRKYLFTHQSVVQREHELEAEAGSGVAASGDTGGTGVASNGSLGIGSLRGEARR
jgi:ferritin-like protein